ncbi:MAG: cation diffusion facilitator family transporter [Euryarchaeota archaeon]|nr:MAG: Ferrous-iron efflux pump FieF [ANME-2 cluster archaeon]MEA1866020.1 cation diffusion facilitator family transporter [Euryarchaeota archaeon]
MVPVARDKKAALVSIAVTAFLAAIKFLAGTLSGSIALVADAVHSLTDVISSIGVVIGLKISDRKPTETFPYGFYRAENIVSLFLAFAIIYAGYEIVLTSVEKFTTVKVLTNVPYAIVVALISLLFTLLLSRYKLKVGREENSPSLIADGEHTRADTYASAAVLVGILGNYIGFYSLDPASGILVSLFIFKAGYEILKDSIKVLLDASIDYESLNRIREITSGTHGVGEIQSLAARSSGKFIFIELGIGTKLRDLERAHQLSDKIEMRIKSEIQNVDRVLIHIEPEERELIRYAVPCTENNGTLSRVSGHFGEAEYFCIFDVRRGDNEITDMRFLKNPFATLEKRKGLKAAELLVANDIDKLITKESIAQKSPFYVLDDAYVESEVTNLDTIGEIIATQAMCNHDRSTYR